MRIQLSDHFTYPKLLRFVLPSVIMMIFTSIYGIVDGLFVSNYVGKTAFAAVNLMMPFLMILGAPGFMIGTGGSAIVARTMGEGKGKMANRYFTLLVIETVVLGLGLAVLGQLILPAVATLMGAEGEMLEYCLLYSRIILWFNPFYMLQCVFQTFFVTAEKPELGLKITVAAGVTNMVLDALFVAVFSWGLAGAAVATVLSQVAGGLIPVLYFWRENDSRLRFCKTRFYGRVLAKTATNGSSELMSNLSSSLVSVLYNFQLMQFAGEDGVAAYGVVMYVGFFFAAIFLGYSVGGAPIISYHYGAQHHDELKNLLRKSLVLVGAGGCLMTAASVAGAGLLSNIFVGYDQTLCEMTVRGMQLYGLSFLFSGLNIFGSAFFTALNNGLISALISFLRTLVFQVACVLVFPQLLGLDGVWISVVAAELLALGVTATALFKMRGQYHYA